MARNRIYKFLSWNVRGLNDLAKCSSVKSFIRNSKSCLVCLQETKLASTSSTKFAAFCGYHLATFRSLDAEGTRGGLLSAWNPALFDCVQDWVGSFSVNFVLRRKVDGLLFTISNIYGPNRATLRPVFFLELRSLCARAVGHWAVLDDFNVLLSRSDKNGPRSNTSDILNFRRVVAETGLVDLPLRNKYFTWSNGRRIPTLERLDRALVSKCWILFFPRTSLRALPLPRSDHTPILLTASSFVPASPLFRFESYWLRYAASSEVVNKIWTAGFEGMESANKLSSKLSCVRSALRNWSAGLKS